MSASLLIAIVSGAALSDVSGASIWTAIVDAFSRFAHFAAPVAVTALWQGALVAAGLALCLSLAPRVAAAHRFGAWAAGFAALVLLPFVPSIERLAAGGDSQNYFGTATLGSPAVHSWLAQTWLTKPWLELSERWCMAIAALWLALALVRLADLLVHSFRLLRLWQSAAPVNGGQRALAIGSRQHRFELCTTRQLDRPSVIGFFAPRILIPEWLFGRLTPQELEQVILHEAEHLRRRDDWTNLAQKLCLAIFPLNPGLAFIERRLCSEREMACDEGVVRQTQSPRAYAACLAGLAERRLERRAEALSLGVFERRPELARRVHSILARRSALHPAVSRALVGAMGCALVVAAVALSRCPQLVAFAPAESSVAIAAAQPDATDLLSDQSEAQMASHFRAVNAMAVMPEAARRRDEHCRTAANKTSAHAHILKPNSTRLSALAAKETQTGQRQGAGTQSDAVTDVEPGAAMPQEVIVLTTWERFEKRQNGGPVLGDRVISDFDSGTQAVGQPTQAGTSQITITRLIFGVIPVQAKPATAIMTSAIAPNRNSQSGTEQNAAQPAGTSAMATSPQTNSERQINSQAKPLTGLPHAVALGNGWFVIQL